MKDMLFDNPVYNEGPNLTVRRGIKWALENEAFIQGLGHRIIFTRVLPFGALLDSDLELEHDPACRTIEGLAEVMHKVYTDFDEREIVTLVEFDGTEG